MEVSIIIKKENNDTIDKDYVKRDFVINHINAMIEHYSQCQRNDFDRGYVTGLKEVRSEIEYLYKPAEF